MFRGIRIALGLVLILGGLALGLWVGIYSASVSIQGMQREHLAQGILRTILWPELLAMGTASALVLPGMLVLRGLADKRGPVR
jgi:hypothetical protein